jgi:hypothetical protein
VEHLQLQCFVWCMPLFDSTSPARAAHLRDGQATADLPAKLIGDLGVPRYGLDLTRQRVDTQGMATALALELAPVTAKVTQEIAALHRTVTVVRTASDGTPRNPSSRRSSRTRAIASERL